MNLNGDYFLAGRSRSVREAIRQADYAAEYDFNVLITGETGTGKEAIAHLIHDRSKRKRSNFVHVNCGGIPHELVESELFGHEKGSFTGAYVKREGKFQAADNGTLFLDEVGNAPYHAQAAVLSAIEYGTFCRVGSNTPVKVDVRTIAASNTELCRSDKFRQDLYYRLSNVRIDMPPLRERKEDVEDVTNFYLAAINKMTGEERTLEPRAYDVLRSYGFPGNVRELINVLLHAYTMSGNTITAEEIENRIEQETKARNEPELAPANGNGNNPYNFPLNLKDEKALFQRRLIEAALRETGGNVASSAKLVGLKRSNFYRLMKSLGIDRIN